jgi:diguanylate cyclase (GGDEF)-like protein
MTEVPSNISPIEPPQKPTSKILIVDDQPLNIVALHSMFSKEHSIFMASSGEAAIEICRSNPPDLIFMDVVMPGMGGLRACAQLKKMPETSEIPVIFITAGNSIEEESACWNAGGVDFIARPIHAQTVRARARVHLLLKAQADQLREFAYVDVLTAVVNRRFFDDNLLQEIKRALRERTTCSLLILDIDFFKRYNDAYGHLQGDACLKAVAQTLSKSVLRPGDLVGRYGGEEFAIVLPNSDIAAAVHVAERIQRNVGELALKHEGNEVAKIVTVSIGVTATSEFVRDDAASLITRADRCLYRAKHFGRNRIEIDHEGAYVLPAKRAA